MDRLYGTIIGWGIVLVFALILLLAGIILNRHHPQVVSFHKGKNSRTIHNKPLKQKRAKHMPLLSLVIVCLVAALILYHIHRLEQAMFITGPIIFLSFVYMVIQLFWSFRYGSIEGEAPALKTMVMIPSYNEDVNTTRAVLEALAVQTRKPDLIYIVDDGSKREHRSEKVVEAFREEHPELPIRYKYINNSGKRRAQYAAFDDVNSGEYDIYITIDSDTVLDEKAIENGLKPFQDEEVMSVAGLLFAQNRTNLLTRILGVSFTSAFTTGRASWSYLNSVAVSCGGLAFYRRQIIEKYREAYLNQIVFGQEANYGDDRMMTQFASMEGKTLYQETSFAYTLVPENLSHLTRQRTLWWKSFWWGILWVLKNQDKKRPIWWLCLSQYYTFALYGVVLPVTFVILPILTGKFPWEAIIYMLLLSYVRMLSTLRTTRCDVTKKQQILEFVVYAPLAVLLNMYICTILQYHSLLTLRQVREWGTRESLECRIRLDSESEMDD